VSLNGWRIVTLAWAHSGVGTNTARRDLKMRDYKDGPPMQATGSR